MIIVTSPSGQSEIINKFNNFEMYEELNGAFTLNLISYRHLDNPGHDLISEEGFIEYDGYKFRIKQIRRQVNSTQVACLSTFFDNADIFKYDIFGGTHTLTEFMNYTLTNTGWTWTSSNIDVGQSKFIPNFGTANVLTLLEALKTIFGFEVGIGQNNQITISNQLGPDSDYQYRYGHNMVALTESIDTTKLKTYIEGTGADGLHVTYASPYSILPGIGIRHAEPIFDDSYTDATQLTNYIKSQLHDHPDSIIELDDTLLMDKVVGERVWVIHERMAIEYQTRVVARRVKIPNSLSSVTLGTYQPQSRSIGSQLASQRVEIDRNNITTRSKIEQTNDKILLEVARLDGLDAILQSNITIEAGRITQEVTDRTSSDSTLSANITIQANRITTEVSDRQNGDTNTLNNSRSYTEQTATSIRSEVSTEVTRLDGRVTSADSLISQQADEILLRVRKDGVISSINQTAESISINASKINLNGAVSIGDLASDVSAKFTKIDANGIYTGTVKADNITAGTISADVSMTSAKIRTADAGGTGRYIEMWNQADLQPTMKFYASVGLITTNGGSLIIDTGSTSTGNLHLRAGLSVIFDEGTVDFSGASNIVWGTNAPNATFA